MATKRKVLTKTPPPLTPEQNHHRQFKRALHGHVFNSATLAGLVPFTQQHGRGAFQTLPNFDYASQHYPLVVNKPGFAEMVVDSIVPGPLARDINAMLTEKDVAHG